MSSGAIFIYAIGRESGPIKIGISADPYVRVFGLQTACPFKIKLLHKRECRDRCHAMRQERIIHDVLAEKRLLGEWFKIDDDAAIEAIDTSLEVDEYLENYR